MNEKISGPVFQFVTHVINVGGYAGIVALMTLNSSAFRFPLKSSCPFPATWFTWAISI